MSQKRIRSEHQRGRAIALQQRLRAPCFTINEFADTICAGACCDHHFCRLVAAERFLKERCRRHDLDAVEAGLEKVGPDAFFIGRPIDDKLAELRLYSRLNTLPAELHVN